MYLQQSSSTQLVEVEVEDFKGEKQKTKTQKTATATSKKKKSKENHRLTSIGGRYHPPPPTLPRPRLPYAYTTPPFQTTGRRGEMEVK